MWDDVGEGAEDIEVKKLSRPDGSCYYIRPDSVVAVYEHTTISVYDTDCFKVIIGINVFEADKDGRTIDEFVSYLFDKRSV